MVASGGVLNSTSSGGGGHLAKSASASSFAAPTPAATVAESAAVLVNGGGGGESAAVALKKSAALEQGAERLAETAAAHRDREAFVRRLIEFHRHRNVNTPIVSWPSLNGRPLDLHKLYNKVASLGGWERVCEKEKWDEVGMDLDAKSFETCTNGSHALKMLYVRYLGAYEKVHMAVPNAATASVASLLDAVPGSSLSLLSSATPGLLNGSMHHGLGSPLLGASGSLGLKSVGSGSNLSFSLDDKDEEAALLQGRRRFSYLLDSMPTTYNHYQHRSHASSMPSLATLPTLGALAALAPTPAAHSSFTASPYEKLEISLSSGLANEIDFAFNTILLLSSDESHAFRLYNSPRLLDLMLAHIGFFGAGDKYDYRRLYERAWHRRPEDEAEAASADEQKSVEQRIRELARLVDSESAYYDEYVRGLKSPPRRNFIKFWHEAIKPPDDLYDEEDESSDDEEQNEDEDAESTVRQSKGFASEKRAILDLLPKIHNKYLETLPNDELLNLKLPSEVASNAAEVRRIEQVMVTLSNLSFEDNNAEFMANRSSNLFEFLIMCLYCSNTYAEIRKHALDILANVSRRMKLKLLSDKHKRLLLISIRYLIYGNCYNSAEQASEPTAAGTVKPSCSSSAVAATCNDDASNSAAAAAVDASLDRLNILRGLEILTKLCSQHVDSYTDEVSNEKILAQYKLTTLFGAEESAEPAALLEDEETGAARAPRCRLYLDKVLRRLENLLSIQDILILINSLECLYQMTQHSEVICNAIINMNTADSVDSNKTPSSVCKFVTLLVNFLTVDMSHFGIGSGAPGGGKMSLMNQGPMKMYKVVCSGAGQPQQQHLAIAGQVYPQQQQQQQQQAVLMASQQHVNMNQQLQQQQQQQQQAYVKANSGHPTLLQQTLNNQQLAANKALITSNQPQQQQQKMPQQSSQQEQQAKAILGNWLRLCFQADANSALSKAELYPYYQQISKMNAWPIMHVQGFYDTLATTFPQLRFDNENNKIHGLKLVLNVKQQMALRHQIAAAGAAQVSQVPAPATVAASAGAVCVVAAPAPAVSPAPSQTVVEQKSTVAPEPAPQAETATATTTPPPQQLQQPASQQSSSSNIPHEISNEPAAEAKVEEAVKAEQTKEKSPPPETTTTVSEASKAPEKAEQETSAAAAAKTPNPLKPDDKSIEMSPVNDENHADSQLNDNSVKIPRIDKCMSHLNGKEKASVAEQLIKEIDQNLSQTTTTTACVKKDLLAANRIVCNGHYNHTNNNNNNTNHSSEAENENEICKTGGVGEIKVNGNAHTPVQQVPLTNGYANSENPSSSSSSSSLSEDVDMEAVDAKTDDKIDEPVGDEKEPNVHHHLKRKSDEAENGIKETPVEADAAMETSPAKQVVPIDQKADEHVDSNKKLKVADADEQTKETTSEKLSNHVVDEQVATKVSNKSEEIADESKCVVIDAPKENGASSPAPSPSVVPAVTTNGPMLHVETPAAVAPTVPSPAAPLPISKLSDTLINGDGGEYLCEWNNCKRGFSSAKAVYNHVCKYHLLQPNGALASQTTTATTDADAGLLCHWMGCDQVRRQKWSLVNHIQERHCSENALKSALLCRQRGMIPIMNHPQIPNNSLNYSKDAALYAIQRHQRLRPEDFQLTPEEGPITKSLRLLAALILRNLATNSKKAKSILKSYEPILTNIAFDLLESSTAVANCLWQISHLDDGPTTHEAS